MARRSGQNGWVVKRGNVWRGRWLEDVAGQEDKDQTIRRTRSRCRENAMTKPEAKRKLREILDFDAKGQVA